jgi:hypothetical protein
MKKLTVIAAALLISLPAQWASGQNPTQVQTQQRIESPRSEQQEIGRYQQQIQRLQRRGQGSSGQKTEEDWKILADEAGAIRNNIVSAMRKNNSSTGGTFSCMQSCETTYSQCINQAGDWFQRYLCNIDAARCLLRCGVSGGAGGGVIMR